VLVEGLLVLFENVQRVFLQCFECQCVAHDLPWLVVVSGLSRLHECSVSPD
jgi:hypothetical protein